MVAERTAPHGTTTPHPPDKTTRGHGLGADDIGDLHVVVNGSGAAGVAIVKLLFTAGAKDVIMCDSKGIIHEERDDLNPVNDNCNDYDNYYYIFNNY